MEYVLETSSATDTGIPLLHPSYPLDPLNSDTHSSQDQAVTNLEMSAKKHVLIY